MRIRNVEREEGQKRKQKEGSSLGILVFTSRELDMWQCLIQLEMSVEIIWVETFFPPVNLDPCVFYCLDQFDRVWLIVSIVPGSAVRVCRGSHDEDFIGKCDGQYGKGSSLQVNQEIDSRHQATCNNPP